MRILYLNQDFVPEVGAGPARVLEMSRVWQTLGSLVTVLTGMPSRRIPGVGDGVVPQRYRRRLLVREKNEGVPTTRTWVWATASNGMVAKLLSNGSFAVSATLGGWAEVLHCDVVIASCPPLLQQLAGVVLAKLRGVPIIIELRDLWPDYLVELGMLRPKSLLAQALFLLERILLHAADHVVVVTDSFRRRIVAKGVPEARISVISNGVDTRAYGRCSAPPPLPQLHRQQGEVVVGYLGTIGRGQALTQVVQAAELLARRGLRMRFVLVGDGPESGSVSLAAATADADVLVVPSIPKEQTMAFYANCDICLVPLAPVDIFQETVPSKIFEVMACGRPLIASVAGEAAKIIRESAGGVTVSPGDATALANAIEAMVRLPGPELVAMGTRAREYIVQHYDRTALASRYHELLARVVQEAL